MRWRGMCGLAVVSIVAVTVTHVPAAGAAPSVNRIAGPDRYATAAAVSTLYAPGVSVAFVATGENFPDALAAAPAAARVRGPVLLTGATSLPDATAVALDRLDPSNIVVLGGAGVISDGVASQLDQYTAGSVIRVAGGSRYETAAAVAANFPAPVSRVYVASGQAFPDALAAGSIAGEHGAPLLLVEPNNLPSSTAAQLQRLAPTTIVIAGGTAAVSAAVEAQLGAYASVVRVAGADRFATSAALSQHGLSSADLVQLATGANFPDALAGGAYAGPVLLVQPTCVPSVVRSEIDRLGAASVTLLGGEAVLAPSVASLQPCGSSPPPPPPPPSQPITFSDGTYVVGNQLPASTYRTRVAASGCYWERLRGFSGSFGDIIANEFTSVHQVVTVLPTDAGFSTDDCGVWTDDLRPLTSSPTAPFGDGTWIVGSDIAAGTWSSPGSDGCYWERTSGFTGSISEILGNDFGGVNNIVTIAATDVGFQSEDCGVWTRVG